MKYALLVLPFFLIGFTIHSANAQVAIGTSTPAPGTMLHVEDASNSMGVLFPKTNLVALNNTSPLPLGIEEGTLVYNSNTSIGIGYYYWDGAMWQRLNAYVGQMARFENADSGNSSVNLNQGNNTLVKVPILGVNPTFNDNSVLYNLLQDDTLQIAQPGRYQITVGMSLTAFMNKAEIEARIFLANASGNNAKGIGAFYRSTEMTATAADTENGSITFTEVIETTLPNQRLSIRTKRAFSASSGPVYLRDNGSSFLFIEKLL